MENKTVLLFDNITKTMFEFTKEQEQQIIYDKHDEYKDEFIIFGKDYFEGHNVWFIKRINDSELTRLTLHQIVLDYLQKN